MSEEKVRGFGLTKATRLSLLSDLNICGNLTNKIYNKMSKEFGDEIPLEIKEMFSKLSVRFSEIHAKLFKLNQVEWNIKRKSKENIFK